jgi:EmrB/QacA subfamily drug resistance transporter
VTPETAVPAADPRKLLTLAIIIPSIFIIVLDNSVLNVAIPTILRDFHTTLPSLQWVVTGYSLTFATLLIIGGRLGDLYGHRRIFIIGAALFGVGSLIASISTSVGELVLGEAIIEGIGAALMMPASLAILSNTFEGRQRATAFAAWGATAGVGASFGPVLGGFLTTYYSWRWAFRINVVVAPIAILGAVAFMRATTRAAERIRLDVPGALLVASGMFLLVFGLSEGPTYGWLTPERDFTIGGATVWNASNALSVIPVVFVVAVALLGGFYVLERAKERRGTYPLFEFGMLRRPTFRYGLLTTIVLAMGQLGMLFVLPVFLQDGKHLSAWHNGLWMVPAGLFVIAGAQLGGRLTRRYGTTAVVRMGLAAEAVGILMVAFMIRPQLTFFELAVGLLFYAGGIGFASAQLTNVVLSGIEREKSGVASGANTTARQVGIALGVAVIGALLSTQTTRHAVAAINASHALSTSVKAQAVARVHAVGASFVPPAGASHSEVAALRHALATGVAGGARPALIFATVVVALGAALSFLIPHVEMPAQDDEATELHDILEAVQPIDPDPALAS